MVMKEKLRQGDIIKFEKIQFPVLVVSKDFFNEAGMIVGCPILEKCEVGALHIPVNGKDIKGYVQCEMLKVFDVNIRRGRKVDSIHMADIMNVTDAIQGIFDYI